MSKHYAQDIGSVVTTRASFLDEIINLARKSSIFYLLFGLACCGIELMQTGGPRADIDRFGSVPRARHPFVAHEAHRPAADIFGDLLERIGFRDPLRHDEADLRRQLAERQQHLGERLFEY